MSSAKEGGPATGPGPRFVSRQIVRHLGGNLVRALAIARTETLRSLGLEGGETDAGRGIAGTGETEPAKGIERGAEWFARQPELTQLRVLGPAKLAAYKSGALTLDDLVGYRDDPRWGPTRWERSLAAAIGEERAAEQVKAARVARLNETPGESRPMLILARERKLLLSSLATSENRIRNDRGRETLVAFRDGKGVLARRARGVSIEIETIGEQLRGCILTHNHPFGSPPTFDDIRSAFRFGMAEMRVVTRTRTYSLKPGLSPWTQDEWEASMEARLRSVRRAVQQEMSWEDLRISRFDAEWDHETLHRMWKRLAEDDWMSYNVSEVIP